MKELDSLSDVTAAEAGPLLGSTREREASLYPREAEISLSGRVAPLLMRLAELKQLVAICCYLVTKDF